MKGENFSWSTKNEFFRDILKEHMSLEKVHLKSMKITSLVFFWHFIATCEEQHSVKSVNIEISLHKKWSFALRISSVNVTKSSKNCLLRVRKRGLKKSYLDTFQTVQDFAKVSIWYWISCFRLTGNRNEDFEIRQMALNEADKLKNEVSIMDILFYFFFKNLVMLLKILKQTLFLWKLWKQSYSDL